MSHEQRTWMVDSVEEGVASIDDGDRMISVPAWLLPEGVREGDLLAVTREEEGEGVTLSLRIDREATARALDRSRRQVETRPPPNDPGGDIVL